MFIKIGLLAFCAVLWNGVTTDGLSVFPTGCNPFLRAICDKRCLRIFYLPVCGSDGVTYSNNCYLSIAECLNGVTKVHNGKCRDLPIESGRDCKNVQFCYEIYTPVCGSDGKTYDNLCFLQQANCRRSRGMPRIFQDYNGQCKKPCDQIACTKDYRPVCGSDGVTYSNPCVLSVASCRATENGVGFPIVKAYDGSCKCLDSCITVYDPVCGSDGKTYSNGCFLGIASCQSQSQRGPAITINHKGECRKCIDICPAIYAPVCGSDGKTYSSSCDLAAVSCKSVREGGPEITEKNKGECVCNDICPEIYAPICGSDGKTYSNACFLEAARCKSVSEGGSEITEKSKGECVCNEVCTFIYEPICGSDGKTYDNACVLESASCKSVSAGGPEITEKSKGECASGRK